MFIQHVLISGILVPGKNIYALSAFTEKKIHVITANYNIGETRASCHKAYITFWDKTILTEKSELLLAWLHQHIKSLSLEPALVQVHFKRKKSLKKKERMPPLLMENLLSTRESATDWTYRHHHKISPALSCYHPVSNSTNIKHFYCQACSLSAGSGSINEQLYYSWNTTKIYSAACNHNYRQKIETKTILAWSIEI